MVEQWAFRLKLLTDGETHWSRVRISSDPFEVMKMVEKNDQNRTSSKDEVEARDLAERIMPQLVETLIHIYDETEKSRIVRLSGVHDSYATALAAEGTYVNRRDYMRGGDHGFAIEVPDHYFTITDEGKRLVEYLRRERPNLIKFRLIIGDKNDR